MKVLWLGAGARRKRRQARRIGKKSRANQKSSGRPNSNRAPRKSETEEKKFPESIEADVVLRHLSAGTRTERGAGRERTRAHAEARAERRGNVSEEIAAAGAAAIAAERSGDIGAEPVTAGFALRINALHRKAGQVLHFFSLRGCVAQADLCATLWRPRLEKI
jgi:hypothetical protein